MSISTDMCNGDADTVMERHRDHHQASETSVLVTNYTDPSQTLPASTYNSKLAKYLAIGQLVTGGLDIIVNISAVIVQMIYAGLYGRRYTSSKDESPSFVDFYYFQPTYVYYVGVGIWCPIIFISLSAGFGLMAARKRTAQWVAVTLIFTAAASVAMFGMFCVACQVTTIDLIRLGRGLRYSTYGVEDTNGNGTVIHKLYLHADTALPGAQASMALSFLFVFITAAEFVLCIWVIVLCSPVACRNRTPPAQYCPSVQYTYTQEPYQQIIAAQHTPEIQTKLTSCKETDQSEARETSHDDTDQSRIEVVVTSCEENDQSQAKMVTSYQETDQSQAPELT